MNSGTILVVEDNPITRKLLRVTLEIEGYDVLDAGDGRTALAKAAERRPELVVLDLLLPDMDGLELLAKVRAALNAPALPAIVVTGMVSRLDELRTQHDGSALFMGKPLEPSRLVELVRAQLASVERRAGGRRILVVDDEALNLKLTSFRLTRAGFEVETASGGQEALDMARQRAPDAILSDVMMPSMDGFSFCRAVRLDPALRAIPIVLVSAAYVAEADRELARQMGASALVIRTPDLGDATAALQESLRSPLPAPQPMSQELVSALHQERLQVQLDRQTARNDMLLRQGAIQAAALSIIRGLAEVLAQPRDLPQILGDVLVHCLDAAGLSTGLLYTAEGVGQHRLRAQFGIGAERKNDAEHFFGHAQLMSDITASGQALALSCQAEELTADRRDFLARLGHSSALIVPFVVLGETYGTLVLASDEQDLTDNAWVGFARSLGLQFGQTVALGHSLKRLAVSDSRYRAIMEHANDAIFVLDAKGTVMEANHRGEVLLGLERARVVGRQISTFSPREIAADPEYLARFDECLAAGGGRIDDVLLRRGDGALVAVDFALSLSEADGETSVLAIGRDVTERNHAATLVREAQVKVQETAAQYRLLFDGNPHPMWLHDVETLAFLAVNDAAVLRYGWSREEFLRLTLSDVQLMEPVGIAPGAGAGGQHASSLNRHRKKDGTEIDVEITAAPILFLGRRAHLILAADVTAKKALETQLLRAQKMEAVGQLAGGVAHDFNNLLGVITGYSELLLRDLAPGSRERKRTEEIIRASDRAAALTRQLLAFSRRQVLQPRVLDLNESVMEVEKMMRRLISENIQIVSVAAPDLGCVSADEGQIAQVLLNLAINARDAMPGGGKLVIETRNAELDAAYVRLNPEARAGHYVLLLVSDTGCGMDAKTISRIFEPFFTTKEDGKGTGLGLATVYGIVRQSGGTVSVYSEPGLGTTFKVYLPRVDAPVEKEEAVAIPAPPRGTETIMLVEDSESLRLLIREVLESAGYTVLDAGAPDEALSLLQSTLSLGPIDLVLTDMVMPRMSGQEMARRIAVFNPTARVVFMSGYAEQVVGGEETLEPGTLFLQKPFTMDSLLTIVARALAASPVGVA